MLKLARFARLWYARRALLLAGAFAVVMAASIAQFITLRASASMAAAAPVALLVTLQITLVLAYLLARHLRLWLRTSALPGWIRSAERRRVREAPVVAAVGSIAAVVLTLASPALAPMPTAPPSADSYVYRFTLPDRGSGPELGIATPTDEPVDAPVRKPDEPAPASPQAADPEPVRQAASRDPVVPAIVQDDESSPERSFQRDVRRAARAWLDDGSNDLFEIGTLMRQGVPSRFDYGDLPAPHLSTAAVLGKLGGRLRLSGDASITINDIRSVIGESASPGAEMTSEIAIGRRDVVRVELLGLFAHGDDESIGAYFDSLEEGEFTLWWEHAFFGLSHRFVGFEREAMFDVALNVGLAFDILDAEIRAHDGRSASLDLIVAAPTIGVSIGLWQTGAVGFLLDASQSVPLNIGGQAVAVTDLRAVMKCDLSERISIFGGYRWTNVRFYDHHRAFGGDDRDRSAEFMLSGPVVGFDLRF